ncbi:MAG TPA: hypothetical protein VGI10_02415 [Polyangiaceae bacterium]
MSHEGVGAGSIEVGENVALLFSERMSDGHDAVALGAERALPPKNEGAQVALSEVVGRLEPVVLDESPKRRAVFQDVGVRARDAAHAKRFALLEERLGLLANDNHITAKFGATERPVAHAMPIVEEQLGVLVEPLAKPPGGIVALRECRELAQQVSPADLAAIDSPEAELLGSVADEPTAHLAEQHAHSVLGAIGSDKEHGDERGREGPQRARLFAASPASRIGVLDRLSPHELHRFVDGGSNGGADTLFRFAERAERHADPEHVLQERNRLPATEVIAAGEKTHERDEARPEHRPWNPERQRRSRVMATMLALYRVTANLRYVRLELGQLHDLVPPRIGVGNGAQRRTAPRAFGGKDVLTPINLRRPEQNALIRLVARLPSRPAPVGWLGARFRFCLGVSVDGGLLELAE